VSHIQFRSGVRLAVRSSFVRVFRGGSRSSGVGSLAQVGWFGSSSLRLPLRVLQRTNQPQCPRNPGCLETQSQLARSTECQFALHSPLATPLVPRSQPRIEARNRRTFPLIERWSPRAVLTFVPGAEGRLWLRWMAAGNPTSLGVTTSVPAPLRRHRAASPLIGRPSPRPSHCPRAR
jgi:hypothetical protein